MVLQYYLNRIFYIGNGMPTPFQSTNINNVALSAKKSSAYMENLVFSVKDRNGLHVLTNLHIFILNILYRLQFFN